MPGGTERNFASYGEHIQSMSDDDKAILCDPQTSGGLLVAVNQKGMDAFNACIDEAGLDLECIGELQSADEGPVLRHE